MMKKISAEDFDLILYDIDGTLIDTGGAGMSALRETALARYGREGPSLDLAGSTDLGIIHGVLEHFQMPRSLDEIELFLSYYHERLQSNLQSAQYDGKVLDGAVDSLNYFAHKHTTIGLLTGNTARGAEIKMKHYGLHHWFPFGAYGDDEADRNLLGKIALDRAAALVKKSFHPERTLIIGDTPKDIACAKACGASCLAVATGKFSFHELSAYHPEYVVHSLRDVVA